MINYNKCKCGNRKQEKSKKCSFCFRSKKRRTLSRLKSEERNRAMRHKKEKLIENKPVSQ